ncbi:hypothetical protein [Bdellovibrio sp. HCB288]|uniref:hypothetical protein n=1 Tax=Bdellovibrio sp. HCB288 TaxID=3394355 RepID=UPI0039B46AD8
MKTLFFISLLLLAGCATSVTHLTDAQSAWVSIRRTGTDEVFWCETAKDKAGAPICYEAEMKFRKR